MASRDRGLVLLDELAAEGRTFASSGEVAARLGLSPQSTSNLLRRLVREGLLDRVSRGQYVVRSLGVLGTPAAAEDLATAVGAAFSGTPHRIGYRSALDELELLVHPARTIQVASAKRVRRPTLSQRPLKVVVEPEELLDVGAATARGLSRVGRRAGASRRGREAHPGRGVTTLAEAMVAAGGEADPDTVTSYAASLRWGAALRRIGSVADRIEIEGLAGRLSPLRPPSSDLDLEPSATGPTIWRDSKWGMRWATDPDDLAAAIGR